MFAQERQNNILGFLKERPRLSVSELEKLLGASPATVRRDLGFLEEAGRIFRTHGGVLSAEQGTGEISYDRRSRHELNAKKAIAETAAGLVKDGHSVFVDAGTTAFKVGVRLLAREKLTIFTNSVPLLNETPVSGCRLVALGGEVRAAGLALVGSEAIEWMSRIWFDLAFVGTSGIDPEKGPCTTELGEAAVKNAAVRNSRRAVLLANDSKWGQQAPIRFAHWDDLDDVVTDHRATPHERAILSSHRVSLHVVKK